VIPIVALALLRIGASLDDQKKLDPEQAEFLSAVKNVDQKTIDDFKLILGKMPANTPTKQFVSIFLRRSATLDGTAYFRAGIASFPFYTELLKREGAVHGVKLRKKDYDNLIALFDYILPHQGEANYYSRGSDSRTAPSTDAIMKTVMAVAGPLNDVVARFGDLLPEGLEIPCAWAETFENIGSLINEIREVPMLQGNEGAVPEAKTAVQTPAVAQAQATAAVPARVPIPGTTAAAPGEYRAPVPGTVAGTHAARSNTTDLETLLRSNPALAAQAGYRGAQWGGQQQQPQQTRASWGNPVTPTQRGGGWNNTGNGWNRGGGGNFGGGFRPSI
jgi:hypothetical protein